MERRFFFYMALAIFLTILAGFGSQILTRRVMLCGTILLTAPALSRLAGFLHPGDVTPLAVVAGLLAFISAGIIFDRRVWHRIHPSYWWGLAVVTLVELSIIPVGNSALVVGFTHRLTG